MLLQDLSYRQRSIGNALVFYATEPASEEFIEEQTRDYEAIQEE